MEDTDFMRLLLITRGRRRALCRRVRSNHWYTMVVHSQLTNRSGKLDMNWEKIGEFSY